MGKDGKFFGENGIFSENGKKYYGNQLEKKLDKMSEKTEQKKKVFKENVKGVLITSYALTFLLNVIFSAQFGYSLISMLGMSLVEFPVAIPFGILFHNIYKSIKGDINKKLDKEVKKIDEYNSTLERIQNKEAERLKVLEQTETSGIVKSDTIDSQNREVVTEKVLEQTNKKNEENTLSNPQDEGMTPISHSANPNFIQIKYNYSYVPPVEKISQEELEKQQQEQQSTGGRGRR